MKNRTKRPRDKKKKKRWGEKKYLKIKEVIHEVKYQKKWESSRNRTKNIEGSKETTK